MKTYILSQFGKPIAVVQAVLISTLRYQIQKAIILKTGASANSTFEWVDSKLPNDGETVKLKLNYGDGVLKNHDEFSLTKIDCYN
jgi:hypothetical protein